MALIVILHGLLQNIFNIWSIAQHKINVKQIFGSLLFVFPADKCCQFMVNIRRWTRAVESMNLFLFFVFNLYFYPVLKNKLELFYSIDIDLGSLDTFISSLSRKNLSNLCDLPNISTPLRKLSDFL